VPGREQRPLTKRDKLNHIQNFINQARRPPPAAQGAGTGRGG